MADYQPIPRPELSDRTYTQTRDFRFILRYTVRLKLMRDDVEELVRQHTGEDESVSLEGQIDADLHGSEILVRDKTAEKFEEYEENELAFNLTSSHSDLTDDDHFTVTVSSSQVKSFTSITDQEIKGDLEESLAKRVEIHRMAVAGMVSEATSYLDLSEYHASGDVSEKPQIAVDVEDA